jgi:hypothetical protein
VLGRIVALLAARPTRPAAGSELAKRPLTRVVERLRHEQIGAIAAGVLAACGGLAALWFLLMLIAFGAVQHAAGTAAVAGALALAWFAGFIHRMRRRPNRSQRTHRERRGF